MTPAQIGNYRVDGVLGEGANGLVFGVTCGDSGARLALKRLRPDHGCASDLKREFRVVADLYHRNLVLPHALESDEEGAYLTMELVLGVPWTGWVREEPLPARWTRLRDALAQAASGLDALHRRGLVHRDIKPTNVLVEDSGRVAILDFGLAQSVTVPPSGELAGTPVYWSPEVLWGLPCTAAADAYALGVLLYEVIAGHLPFGDDPVRSIDARLSAKPPIPMGVPEDLGRVCLGLLDPRPETRWSAADVLRALDPGGHSLGGQVHGGELFGRDAELATLRDAWRRADAETTTVVVRLVGRSGMGKSALLSAFATSASQEAWVLEARSYERDAIPYKALDAAIEELARRLRSAPSEEGLSLSAEDGDAIGVTFPELRGALTLPTPPTESRRAGDPAARRRRVASALADLMARVGDRHGLILLLDDLQWGDLDSARLLADVLRARPRRCLVVLAERPDLKPHPFFAELSRSGALPPTQTLSVEPLPYDVSTALALALCNGRTAIAEAAVAQADGCPFILEMLLTGSTTLAPTLEGALNERLAGLSPLACGLLESLCLSSRPVEQRRVPVPTNDRGTAWAAWAALAAARLIRSSTSAGAPAVEAYHDRIREAVTAGMTPADRTRTHRQLGEAFAQPPTDAEAAATHYALADDRASALTFAQSAATTAQNALAFDRAAQFLELALRCAPESDTSLRARLEVDLARTLANAGRGADAAQRFLQCAKSAGRWERLDHRREAMEHLLVAGKVEEGEAVLAELLRDIGIWQPTNALVIQGMLLVEVGRLLLTGPRLRPEVELSEAQKLEVATFASIGKGMSSYDASLGAWFFLRAADRALSWGAYEPAIRGVAYMASLLGFMATDFTLRRAEAWIAEGERLAASRGDEHGRAVCGVARGMIACCAGSWAPSLATFDEAARILKGHAASRWESNTARSTSLFVLVQLGDLGEVRRRATAMSLEAGDCGDLSLGVEADLYLAYAALGDDDVAAADACIDRNLRAWTARAFLFQHWIAARFRTMTRLYEGDGASALREMEEALPRAKAANLTTMQVVRIEAADLHGRAAIAASARSGRKGRERLLALAERCAATLEGERCLHARAPAHVLRAGVAAARRKTSATLRELQEASTTYERAGMQVHALVARWHHAAMGQQADDRAAIERLLVARGVRDPRRWASMHLSTEVAC